MVYIKKFKKSYIYRTQSMWAYKALERDNFVCQWCKSSDNIIVHHIDESRIKGIKKMNNDLDNLISLCRTCHAKAHGQLLVYKNPRTNLIIELKNNGLNFSEIAKYLGISRQRVHQIVKKMVPIFDPLTNGGVGVYNGVGL